VSLQRSGARLKFQQIEKKFRGTGVVIDRVSFSVEPGEFVTILGPSGCGKSTFLKLAAGLDRTTGGEIELDSFGQTHFRSFVFQDAHLLPWLNVVDNIALPLELIGVNGEQARIQAEASLSRVHLTDAGHKYPNQLSGGMRMRAAVARALITKPTLLLMDEPFAALDENTRHRLQEELRELWLQEQMTVLFVTHSVSEAVFLSSRAVVLSARPAKVVLDTRIQLQEKRDKNLRLSSEFSAQMRLLHNAFNTEAARV
jgi:NitT/TauT family transport system ATP-binding protein